MLLIKYLAIVYILIFNVATALPIAAAEQPATLIVTTKNEQTSPHVVVYRREKGAYSTAIEARRPKIVVRRSVGKVKVVHLERRLWSALARIGARVGAGALRGGKSMKSAATLGNVANVAMIGSIAVPMLPKAKPKADPAATATSDTTVSTTTTAADATAGTGTVPTIAQATTPASSAATTPQVAAPSYSSPVAYSAAPQANNYGRPPVSYAPPANNYAPSSYNYARPTNAYTPPASQPPSSYYASQSRTPPTIPYYPTSPGINYGRPPVTYGSSGSAPVVMQKRGIILQREDDVIEKRGDVKNTAGALVTGLMVVGLAKELFSAIAPKSRQQAAPVAATTAPASSIAYTAIPQYAAAPPPAFGPMMYSPAPQVMLRARDLGGEEDEKNRINQESGVKFSREIDGEDRLTKRDIMTAAGHFVTVGFAVQALRDNTGPVMREIVRLQHLAKHQFSQIGKSAQLPPQQLAIPTATSPYHTMYKREVDVKKSDDATETNKEDENDHLIKRGAFMEHPAVGHALNGAGILVTISMLTGMAGQYVDQGIKKVKDLLPKPRPAAPTLPATSMAYPAVAYPGTAYSPYSTYTHMKKRSLIIIEESLPKSERSKHSQDEPIIIKMKGKGKIAILFKRFYLGGWLKKAMNKTMPYVMKAYDWGMDKYDNRDWQHRLMNEAAYKGWIPKSLIGIF